MANNPRKFSEKIALHTHRQAEETARFEQIMREVSDATSRVQSEKGGNGAAAKNTLRIGSPALGAFRGGSLPNVSAPNHAKGPSTTTAAAAATATTTTSLPSKNGTGTDKAKPEEVSQPHTNMHYRESRARSQGGPIRRPQDRRHDTSPYSSGPFLSPPPDTSWRRTNSDSALHQSAMQGMSNERTEAPSTRWMGPSAMNGPTEQHDNRRPRSSCEVPRVPGINIYHTAHEPGTIQIPIGNNTGSLPDLTSVHFPSPIHTPLDQDHDQGSSPYSSSPVNTSPSTLSPTSVPAGVRPQQQQQGRFQFGTPPVSSHQNHLSVPVNSRYLHHSKSVTLDKNPLDNQDFTQLRGMSGIYQQQVPPASPSPTLQQVAGYRSPRPSPQSSPSLGGRHSAPSSPSAPSPLSPLPTNDYQMYNQHQAAQLQQHFEQFSMDWAQLVASLVESGCTWSAQVQMDTPVSSVSYMDQPTVHLVQSQAGSGGGGVTGVTGSNLIDMATEFGDAGYYSTSPSQLVYHTAPPSIHTTPNTPNSIPDIILTDFSSAADELTGGDGGIDGSELTLSEQLDMELLTNKELREGLEPLDPDGLQMLSNSGINLIPDGVEDYFRLDRS